MNIHTVWKIKHQNRKHCLSASFRKTMRKIKAEAKDESAQTTRDAEMGKIKKGKIGILDR